MPIDKKVITTAAEARKQPASPDADQDEQRLAEARYQADQAFQRGGYSREEAYALNGLTPDGKWRK